LGFDPTFVVDRTRRSGGLALFWRHPFECSLQWPSSNHIDLEVT